MLDYVRWIKASAVFKGLGLPLKGRHQQSTVQQHRRNPWRWLVIGFSLWLLGCSNIPDEPAYQASKTLPPLGQSSFAEYVKNTQQWLMANRLFLSEDIATELAANSPFEVLPPIPLARRRGIILVHGLTDSPYSFVDIAPQLAKMGFHVRTLLLEGHGSRPADLLNADHKNWRRLLAEQVAIFKQEVTELYLGGFSTGANLVTLHALADPQIAGLVLFSPGFKSSSDYVKYAPVAAVFNDWVYAPSLARQKNYVRYFTAPNNGFAQYYHTSSDVMAALAATPYDKPVFIALSEDDSVIDVRAALGLFEQQMVDPRSRLIWYGTLADNHDQRVITFAGRVPAMHVSNFSHMGVLFDPHNPYYGFKGTQRICNNGQSDAMHQICASGGEIWFSAWGYNEVGKSHARLTFNPWFDEMIQTIRQVLMPVAQ